MAQYTGEQADFLFLMVDQFDKAALTIWGEDRRLLYMNQLGFKLSGLRREEAVGKTLQELFPDAEPIAMIERVLETEHSVSDVEHFDRPTGHWKTDYFFLRLPDGRRAVGIRSRLVTIEVNAQRELEQEKQNLHTVLQKIPAACSLTAKDKDGRMFIALSNEKHDLWAGKGPLTGRYADDLFPELKEQTVPIEGRQVNAFTSIDQVFENKKPFAFDGAPLTMIDKNGVPQNLILNSRVEPVFDSKGAVSYVLVFSVDVTKEAQTLRELEETTKALEAAVRVRDDFISVASHELRTPISTVMLVAEGIPRVTELVQDEVARKRLVRFQASLARQSARLTELVDDMLAVSIGDTDLIRPTKFDLANLVRETTVKLGDAAEQAKCKLILSLAPTIGTWDAGCLTQIVTNFLSNAIKYGAGHPIQVRSFQKDRMVVLTVRDFGPGVKEEDTCRIFRKFERAVPVGTFKGLGLGLWIASRAAHQIGASLKVRAPEDGQGGSQFELYLPMGISEELNGRHTGCG